MEKEKSGNMIWRDESKPRMENECSSGKTFWPDKKEKQGDKK